MGSSLRARKQLCIWLAYFRLQMDPKRIIDISEMTKNVTAGKIFVTTFQIFAVFKKFSDSLAWETKVWISEMPDHMIHLNGDRFMRPRE